MTTISIRITDKLLHDMNTYAEALHMPRAKYIREAIEHMNNEMTDKIRKNRLKNASLRVRKESMKVNAEFGSIENDPKI